MKYIVCWQSRGYANAMYFQLLAHALLKVVQGRSGHEPMGCAKSFNPAGIPCSPAVAVTALTIVY